MKKLITLVVPICNAQNTIKKLLESIKLQSDNQIFEVVFVDNMSTDNTIQLIQGFLLENPEVDAKLLYYDKHQSSYAARNYGVIQSNSDILSFTDADCELSENYIERIEEYFSHNEVSNVVVAGNIQLVQKDKRNLWENFDKASFLQNNTSELRNSLATANMVVNRDLFNKIGFFLRIKSTGDSEWSARAVQLGSTIRFVPEISVSHPTRKTFDEINKKICRIGYGKGERWNKNVLLLILVYFFKIFNYRTNYLITRNIIKKTGISGAIKFNVFFHILRINQLLSAVKGYRNKNMN